MSYIEIRRAIVERASLTAVYEDYVRYFSPHMLGKHANGVPIVLAFQYGGGKPGGPLLPSGEWCCYLLPRLHYVRRNGDKWASGTATNKPIGMLRQVDVAA
jgi:hypothetical protein